MKMWIAFAKELNLPKAVTYDVKMSTQLFPTKILYTTQDYKEACTLAEKEATGLAEVYGAEIMTKSCDEYEVYFTLPISIYVVERSL